MVREIYEEIGCAGNDDLARGVVRGARCAVGGTDERSGASCGVPVRRSSDASPDVRRMTPRRSLIAATAVGQRANVPRKRSNTDQVIGKQRSTFTAVGRRLAPSIRRTPHPARLPTPLVSPAAHRTPNSTRQQKRAQLLGVRPFDHQHQRAQNPPGAPCRPRNRTRPFFMNPSYFRSSRC